MRAEGIYIGEETAVISLMIAIFKKEELSADQAINIAMGNQLINYDEIDILRKKQNKSWKEIANIYGITSSTERGNIRKGYSRYIKKKANL